MRRIVALVLMSALVLSGRSITTFAQTAENCPDTAPSRLTIGEQGRVLTGNPNNVREQPSRESLIVGKIPSEAVFTVLDGPICADGVSWWQVDYEGLVGWTAEAIGFEYAVESLASYTIEIDSSGVSFTLPSEIAINAYAVIEEKDGNVPMPLPGRVEFTFEYADEHDGYITLQVMPAEEFNALYPDTLDIVAEQLETRPEVPTTGDAPFHPGNRTITSQPAYVEFEGGAGIREVAAFTFSVDPVSLDYVFVGLSDSRNFVILMRAQVVSAAANALEFDADTYETYLENAQAVVDATPADEFSPSLALIDQMIATLYLDEEILTNTLNLVNGSIVCKVTPINDTNVREGPYVELEARGYVTAGTEYSAVRQAIIPGQAYPWWELSDDAGVLPPGPGLPSSGRWLRADFVKEAGDCDNLPQY